MSKNKNYFIKIYRTSSNLPLTIGISSEKVDCTSPAYIKCNTIECSASEVLLNAGIQSESVVLECDTFSVACSNKGTLPIITNKGSIHKSQFQIICRNQLSYPFVEYATHTLNSDIPIDIADKYHKMRRLLLMFRSHSKGSLARFKEKIDNRIGKGDVGREVLDTLIKAGILYSDEKMYFIDPEMMAQKLGVKYDDIRSSIINDKIKRFLS